MQRDSVGSAYGRAGVDQQIARCIQFALRGTATGRTHDERRRQKRHPFPYPVRLTPVNAQLEAIDSQVVVLGKHLTTQGFDFYFQQPLSHRRVIASFDCELPQRVEMLMDLTWCRFSGHGWYENGGRFLAAVKAPPTDRCLPLAAELQQQISVAAATVGELQA